MGPPPGGACRPGAKEFCLTGVDCDAFIVVTQSCWASAWLLRKKSELRIKPELRALVEKRAQDPALGKELQDQRGRFRGMVQSSWCERRPGGSGAAAWGEGRCRGVGGAAVSTEQEEAVLAKQLLRSLGAGGARDGTEAGAWFSSRTGGAGGAHCILLAGKSATRGESRDAREEVCYCRGNPGACGDGRAALGWGLTEDR